MNLSVVSGANSQTLCFDAATFRAGREFSSAVLSLTNWFNTRDFNLVGNYFYKKLVRDNNFADFGKV